MSSNRHFTGSSKSVINSNSKEHRISANNISRQTGIPENNSNMSSNRHFTGSSKSVINSNSGVEHRGSTKNISTLIASSGHDSCRSKYNEKCKELDNRFISYEYLERESKASSGHDSCRSKYNEKCQEFNNLFISYQDLEMKCIENSQELENLRLKYQKSDMSYKKYKENCHRLLKQNNDQKNYIKDLQTELENSERKNGELEMNYGELKMNYESKNKSIILLEKKVDTLESEKNNSIKKIEELEADLQKKQNAVITIRNKYKTLQNTNDELSGLAIFKVQSLSFKKQNEDFKYQLSILTKSNENLSTQLELIKNENNQLKAEIKNLKLLKFTSKPISSVSTYNIQDSYNFIDENKMSQVKNEHSTQSFVNNEVESNNKAKHNVNCTESKHFNKFPAWWYNHMNCEISTIQMESTTKENIKSKTNFHNTKSLMFTDASDLQHSDIDNENFQVKNKKSEQTFVNIANKPSRKDENYQINTNHSNHKYRA